MGHRLSGSMWAVVAMLTFSPGVRAQAAQEPGAAKAQPTKPAADFSGVWMRLRPIDYTFTKEPLPLQPWAEEKYKYNTNAQHPEGRGRNELEPSYHCMPPGPTVLALNTHPFEIIQFPNRVLIWYEWNGWIRQIWTDGREHPENLDLTWMGHSIGRWDGDTLVVDTVGIRENWLDDAGHVFSDALHLVERFRRVDSETIEVDYTFDDPKAFTKPWTAKRIFKWQPGAEIMEEVMCEDRFLTEGSSKYFSP